MPLLIGSFGITGIVKTPLNFKLRSRLEGRGPDQLGFLPSVLQAFVLSALCPISLCIRFQSSPSRGIPPQYIIIMLNTFQGIFRR